jgi:hypothetical protein
MTSTTEMVQRVTKLVLPTELASIFDSRLLQHLIMWNCERTYSRTEDIGPKFILILFVIASIVERINLWLEQYLETLIYSQDRTAESNQALNDFLQKVLAMAEFTRVNYLYEMKLQARWHSVIFIFVF